MRRQAATVKGLNRRLGDLHFERVDDPRDKGKVRYPLWVLLKALVSALTTNAFSLRKVEERTGQMARKNGSEMGIKGRIADNTFGKVLPRLNFSSLVEALHRLVKAEHRRGNLKPELLCVGVVAVDGKNVGTLHWHDLCRVVGLDSAEASPEQVKTLLAERYPDMQLVQPAEGAPYALARVHTVTLISSKAAMCIHQRPTQGHTNEVGSMPELLDELDIAYGRTGLFRMVTTDAGNTSLKVATQIVERHGWDYFLQIKSGHGELYREAHNALDARTEEQAEATVVDQQNGKIVTYRVWQHDLTDQGWLDWTHARQLIRIERTELDPATNQTTVGNRYYVCNLTTTELGAKGCLKISRAHWRCENETHWTADTQMAEDRRRHALSRHPNGVFAVSVLRMMALDILSVARKLSRYGYTEETPSWQQVAEHFLLVLCDTVLNTEAFDAVEN